MDSIMSISQLQLLLKKSHFALSVRPDQLHYRLPSFSSSISLNETRRVVALAARPGGLSQRNPVEKTFVDEMRMKAIKLHSRDQAIGGEQQPNGPPLLKWEPTMKGCVKFLVDSKAVYDTLEIIIEKATFPECE